MQLLQEAAVALLLSSPAKVRQVGAMVLALTTPELGQLQGHSIVCCRTGATEFVQGEQEGPKSKLQCVLFLGINETRGYVCVALHVSVCSHPCIQPAQGSTHEGGSCSCRGSHQCCCCYSGHH
jgi:hypothetical protein